MAEKLWSYPQEEFKTGHDFQAYFESLQKALEIQKKKKEKAQKVQSSPELLQKRKEKIEKYYSSNPGKLASKAIEYSYRYNPSKVYIERYIAKKLGEKATDSLVQDILVQVPDREEEIIQAKVQHLRGNKLKAFIEIEMKLNSKGFDKDLIKKYIDFYLEKEKQEGSTQKQQASIIRSIQAYMRQGKSQREISSLLYFKVEDKNLLQELIEQYWDDEIYEPKVKELVLRRYKQVKDIRKVQSWALAKGYDIKKIQQYLK